MADDRDVRRYLESRIASHEAKIAEALLLLEAAQPHVEGVTVDDGTRCLFLGNAIRQFIDEWAIR